MYFLLLLEHHFQLNIIKFLNLFRILKNILRVYRILKCYRAIALEF